MLEVGFAKLDVTPPLSTSMAGYYQERLSDGVLDPIEIVALAAHDGTDTVIMITGDFLGIHEKNATEIRNMISEHTGVPADHITVQGLHQHTSVSIGSNPHLYDVCNPSELHDDAYYNILYRKFVDVSRMAIDDLCEAKMSVAQGETAEKISFIRRYLMKDGSVRTNPRSAQSLANIVAPIGEADNTVRLVKFEREGAKDIALVNFSTHPDTIGGTKFTADWPGFVRRMTEEDLPNTHCIVMTGAQGDTNHYNPFAEPSALTKYEFSARMGRIITDTVIALWDKTEKKEAARVSGQVQMKYIPTNTSRIEDIEECKRLKQEYLEGRYVPDGMGERADIYRTANLHSQSLFQKVAVSVIGIGEVAFVGFGGEPFTQYAADARAAAPNLFVLTTCTTNGYAGYMLTREAFGQGGYEGKNTNFTVGLVDVMRKTVKEMLEQHEAITR